MKRLHIPGAAVALALLAAPALAGAQQTRWYLAEGSTGPFFEEEVLAVNPTDQTASGIVRVYRDGTAVDIPIAIPPRRRVTLPVNLVPGLATGETSAMVDTSASGVPIFVERTMYWNGRRGGHNAGGVEAPQTTWYLAEGATSNFFSTFILLVNPNASAVSVTRAHPQRRRRAGRLPLHGRRQQPVDHSGQRPAAVPQRQLRHPGHRVAAGLRRARDVLARLRGRPRCHRRLQPVVDVAFRRRFHRRRLRDVFPARQHQRRQHLDDPQLLPRQRQRHHQERLDRAEQPPHRPGPRLPRPAGRRRSPRGSPAARRSWPSGRCTGAASSKGTERPA